MNERFILGSKVNDISIQQAVKTAGELLMQSGVHYVVTPNPEICLRGYKDELLREITKRADLALPDGFGLKIGAWILGQNLDNNITGVDFSYEIFKLAEEKNFSVLLIGGKGKSGTTAILNLKSQNPKLKVEYMNGGKFDKFGNSEYPDFIERINQMNPDIILVNLGAPKQEYFMYNNRPQLNTKLMLGVGGTIDFLSGNLSRAPKILRTLGLEWLFRLIQEPRRWKRILNAVILFPLTCIWWRIRNLFFYRHGAVGMIINNDGQILLMKRKIRPYDHENQDHWQLPQGGVNLGESVEKAVLREMREETGLTGLTIIQSVSKAHRYNWSMKTATLLAPYKGQKQDLFLLKYEGPSESVKPDQIEFTDYRWVSKDHILQLAHPFRKTIIAVGLDKFKKFL